MLAGIRFSVLSSVFLVMAVFVPEGESFAFELRNPELSPSQNCREEKHAVARMSCFAELADQENDVGFCDSASPEGLKYKCYAVYATRKLRADVCRQIPAGDVRDGCLSGLGDKLGDPKLCEGIRASRHRDSCYAGVVSKTGQVELCGKIGDRMQQMICSGSFSR